MKISINKNNFKKAIKNGFLVLWVATPLVACGSNEDSLKSNTIVYSEG